VLQFLTCTGTGRTRINVFPELGLDSVKLPNKLKDDSITEALVEIRFASSDLDEVIVGRLSDFTAWDGYTKARLPAADIPLPIRKMDPALRFQPLLELAAPDKSRRVRIGPATTSYHVLGKYIGWTAFSRELGTVTEHFFKVMKNVQAERLGLRYVNALTKARHGIAGVGDLKLQVRIDDHSVGAPLNVNFTEHQSEVHRVTTRVATPEFVTGPLGKDISLLVDVDVFSPDRFRCTDPQAAMSWVSEAHKIEKESFFRLFPDKTIEAWRES
jgi:uncharacterized protein (TIGR04255 family)